MTIRPSTVLFFLAGFSAHVTVRGDAVVPDRLSYQGNVTDANGTPIGATAAVNRTVQFRIYEAATGGTAVWAEQQTVTISAGEFSVAIGGGSGLAGLPGPSAPGSPVRGIAATLVGAGKNYFLGVTIDDGDGNTANDKEIAPRQQLLSGAFALRARTAEAVDASAISSAMIADGTVAAADLASDAVTTGKILNQAVTTAKLADNAVTSVAILDGTIAAADLAGNSVNSSKISDGSVSTADLADSAVTSAKILDGTVALADLADNSVNSGKIVDFSVGNADLATGAVSVDKLNGSSVGIWNVNGTAAYRSSGSVGIGTSQPAATLHVNDTATAEVEISGNAPNVEFRDIDHRTSYWMHNNEGRLYFLWNGGTGATGWNGDRPLTLQNGRVGIGNVNPRAPLDVASVVNLTIDSYGRLTTNGATDDNSSVNTNLSIWAEGSMFATRYDISSDARTKEITGPVSGAESLALLEQIRITEYTRVDTPVHGSRPERKVIAQEIEPILPSAVSRHTGTVPDIYQLAAVVDGWVSLDTDLRAGERVKLIHGATHEVVEVLESIPGAFRVPLAAGVREVFVYGREVEDVRSVDYDAISMLNVSATQELYRRVRTLEERLEAIERRLGAE